MQISICSICSKFTHSCIVILAVYFVVFLSRFHLCTFLCKNSRVSIRILKKVLIKKLGFWRYLIFVIFNLKNILLKWRKFDWLDWKVDTLDDVNVVDVSCSPETRLVSPLVSQERVYLYLRSGILEEYLAQVSNTGGYIFFKKGPWPLLLENYYFLQDVRAIFTLLGRINDSFRENRKSFE